MTAIRPWCAEAQYPGLEPFVFGTISMPADARHDKIMAALEGYALTFLVPGFVIMKPMCGALFYQEEEA